MASLDPVHHRSLLQVERGSLRDRKERAGCCVDQANRRAVGRRGAMLVKVGLQRQVPAQRRIPGVHAIVAEEVMARGPGKHANTILHGGFPSLVQGTIDVVEGGRGQAPLPPWCFRP